MSDNSFPTEPTKQVFITLEVEVQMPAHEPRENAVSEIVAHLEALGYRPNIKQIRQNSPSKRRLHECP